MHATNGVYNKYQEQERWNEYHDNLGELGPRGCGVGRNGQVNQFPKRRKTICKDVICSESTKSILQQFLNGRKIEKFQS